MGRFLSQSNATGDGGNRFFVLAFVLVTVAFLILAGVFLFGKHDSFGRRWVRSAANTIATAAKATAPRGLLLNSIGPFVGGFIVYIFLRALNFDEPGPWSLGTAIVLLLGAVTFHVHRHSALADKQKSTARWTSPIDSALGGLPAPADTLAGGLIDASLGNALQIIKGLFNGGYVPDPLEGMASSFRSFFEQDVGPYTGVDSHLPTEYLDQFEWYLTVHEQALDERRKRKSPQRNSGRDARIIVATADSLIDTYWDRRTEYRKFVQWHLDHGVDLFWIEPTVVQSYRGQYRIGEHTDVSIWGNNYAVLFEQREGDEDRPGASCLRGIVPGVPSSTGTSFEQVKLFVECVRGDAACQVLGLEPPLQSVIDHELAERWEDYVAPDVRLAKDGRLATLLRDELSDAQHVLDAAAGIGAESVFLVKELGKSVVSNEVDDHFRRVLQVYADQQECNLEVKDFDWERLSSRIRGGTRFDAVLCLGNSLSLIQAPKRRLSALISFHDVLLEGGRLIIDERNFEFMLKHRRAIIDSPFDSFPPLFNDPMYCGTRVRGVPLAIEDNRVEWGLIKMPEMGKKPKGKVRQLAMPRTFSLVPFRFGVLACELEQAKFKVLRTYVDLKDSYEGLPPREVADTAQFFTYVAQCVSGGSEHSHAEAPQALSL